MTQMLSRDLYHSSGDVYEEVTAAGLDARRQFHAFLIEQATGRRDMITSGHGTPYQSAIKGCPENCRLQISDFRLDAC